MTKEQAKQLLPIIQAFAEGKEIQIRFGESWIKLTKDPIFSDPAENYRIKPEPREWTLAVKEDTGRPYGEWSENLAEITGYVPVRVREIIE